MQPDDLFLYFALATGLVAAPILLLWGLISLAKGSRRKFGGRKLSSRIESPVRRFRNNNANNNSLPYQVRKNPDLT